MFLKSPDDDKGATDNAAWLMDFQRWVQEQNVRMEIPTFGDDPQEEEVRAQNGTLVTADEEGTAIYSVQLSFNFTKYFEVSKIYE